MTALVWALTAPAPVAGELTLSYERLAVTGEDDHTLLVYQAEPDTPTAERLP